jgi:diguanylate cyclase (GGDEF)-like protein
MALDPATLLLTNVIVMLLVGVSFGAAWLENRHQGALLWMLAAALLTAIGLVCRVTLPVVPAIVISNGLVGAGSTCIWMCCRRLNGRPVLPWLLGVPALLWLGLVCLPGFLDDGSLRLVASNVISVLTFGLAGLEALRLDSESRYLKVWAGGLLLILAAEDFGWAVFNLVAPVVRGTAFISIRGFAFIDITTLVFTLLMAFAMKALIRGQADQGYRRAALVDALTGLGNRRGFDESLARAAVGTRGRAMPIGVVMIDVDSFKLYNDLYGHLKGDACLRAVAQTLQGSVSGPGEAVFRYGGEEFVALLLDYDEAAARAVAERLRLAVRALRLLHGGRESGVVTISLGVAAMTPGLGPTGSTAVLAAADRALYEAKRQGRDRVVVGAAAGEIPDSSPPRFRIRGTS